MTVERPLTGRAGPGGPLGIGEYEKAGGYRGLAKALNMAPKEVQEEVKKANLRGRGGAGFNTGAKWGFVPLGSGAPQPKYLVANADEMEPGTFKDRFLLERDPHQFIEGIIISAYAVEAETAYIYLRWEYRAAASILEKAVAEAYAGKYLGRDIMGSGFGLELRIHTGAGRYICGEETALINSLEGRRPVPRAKPPFPQACGLWGKPTVVNNVETLCNVPHIIRKGAEWYRGLSRSDDGGTKLYGASGKVKRPGLWELPMGTTIREILEGHAGGMLDGYGFRCLMPGGASTEFLSAEHLDTKMDYDSVMAAGSRMGTGTMIVIDDRTCPVRVLLNLERFFARESCGWCTPCREGLPWVEKTLEAVENGSGTHKDLDILNEHGSSLWLGKTFCALAPGAMEPLKSGLRLFKDDFERHIKDGKCPYGALKTAW